MQSLLNADLHRLVGRKGNFYGYMIAFLVLLLVISIGLPMLGNFINNMAAEKGEETMSVMGAYSSPLAFLSSSLTLFGLVSIFVSWCVASFCWSDMRSGFNRSIVSRIGKKAYFAEKLVFALVVSFIFVIVGSIVGTLAAAIFVGLQGIGDVVSLLIWIVLVTLACWGNAALAITVLWLLKSNVLAMLAGLTLASGLISSVVSLMIGSIPTVGEAWGKIVSWFPTEAMTRLSNVIDDVLQLGTTNLAHMLAPTVVCLVVAFICAFTILRRRDL